MKLALASSCLKVATFYSSIIPLDETHLDAVTGEGGGGYLTNWFSPSASTSRARQSDAAPFNKGKQICFVLMPRT